MKNRKWLKLLLILLAVVIAGVVFSCQAKPSVTSTVEEENMFVEEGNTVLSEYLSETTEEAVEQSTEEEQTEQTQPEMICVHVCGSVKKPGVYYLSDNARVYEAVDAAGGLTKEAAADFVNLAGRAIDGEKIYIPSVEEMENESVPTEVQSEESTTGDGKIDINRADADELTALPGIGKTKANAIVQYRKEAGAFTDIKDIMNVSGIGKSSFEKIKDYIKV